MAYSSFKYTAEVTYSMCLRKINNRLDDSSLVISESSVTPLKLARSFVADTKRVSSTFAKGTVALVFRVFVDAPLIVGKLVRLDCPFKTNQKYGWRHAQNRVNPDFICWNFMDWLFLVHVPYIHNGCIVSENECINDKERDCSCNAFVSSDESRSNTSCLYIPSL